MKLVFGSLPDFVAELKGQNITECRLLTVVNTDTIKSYYQRQYTYWVVLTAKLGETVAECRFKTLEFCLTPMKSKVSKSTFEPHERLLEKIEQHLKAEGIAIKKGVWMADVEELQASLNAVSDQADVDKETEYVQP